MQREKGDTVTDAAVRKRSNPMWVYNKTILKFVNMYEKENLQESSVIYV